jgi:hypothetical protein
MLSFFDTYDGFFKHDFLENDFLFCFYFEGVIKLNYELLRNYTCFYG